MSLIVREIDAGEKRTALRILTDDLPRTVAAAVVDEGNAAALADFSRVDQLREFMREFFCRVAQYFLLVIAGNDEIEDGRAHILSSLNIQMPSRSSTSCQFSAPSSFIILRYIKSRMMIYFGRSSAHSAASDPASFVSASMPGMSV